MRDYAPPTDLLRDRVILVTGSGDGIGRAAALGFAACGATVILLDRNIRKLEVVYDEIEQAGHPQAAIYPMNLEGASPKDYCDLAQVLEQEFSRLDGLLHNAAILQGLTPIIHYDIETWFRVMQVNLNAPFMLTQALLGLLKRAEDASIAFTVDSVSDEGRAYWGAYGVAKGGIKTLMKILANELEENTTVRVNGVYPGPTRTNLRLRAYPAGDPSQWAAPETILNAYLYLMGPDSKGITGKVISAQSNQQPN